MSLVAFVLASIDDLGWIVFGTLVIGPCATIAIVIARRDVM